jgi:hypothetical protein
MRQSELTVINSLLQAIGESPINEVDTSNPDVLAAQQVWEQFSSSEQSHGWWYNTETWDLPVNADGKVYLPSNTLSVVSEDSDWIKRGRKLYDLETHSFDFSDEDEVEVDIVTEWEVDELPPVMFNYILAKCRWYMVATYALDTNLLQVLEQESQIAYHKLQVQNLKSLRPSATGSGAAQTLLQNQPQTR